MAGERKTEWPDWITQRQPSRTHSQPFNENINRDLTDDRPQSLLPYLTFNHPPPAKYTQTELITHQDKHIGTTPLPPIVIPKIDTRDQTTQAQAYLRDNETMTAVPPNLISRSTMVSPRLSKHTDQGSSHLHGLTISPVIMPVQYVYDRHHKPPRISPMEVRLGPVFVTDTRKQTTTSWQFLPHEQNGKAYIVVISSYHQS